MQKSVLLIINVHCLLLITNWKHAKLCECLTIMQWSVVQKKIIAYTMPRIVKNDARADLAKPLNIKFMKS